MMTKEPGLAERHILIFNDKNIGFKELNSNIHTLGRHPSRDIYIRNNVISREHATFVRVHTHEDNKFEYQVIDGGPSRKESRHGIFINSKRCYVHLLRHGEIISFTSVVKAIYLKFELNDTDLIRYVAMIPAKEIFDNVNQNNVISIVNILYKKVALFS